MIAYAIFEGPAKFFVYGSAPGEPPARHSKGFETLTEVEDFIFDDKKIHPGWEYSVWESKGWKEVKVKV